MLFWLIVTTVIVLAWAHMLWKASKLPPGPNPFPLVGNIPQFALDLYREGEIIKVLRKWQKKYGNVSTLWMGNMPTVNICDYQTAHDLMVKKGQLFTNRYIPFVMSNELTEKIDSAGGQIEVDTCHFLEITVGNIINRMLFTERFTEEKEAKFFKLKGDLDKAVESVSVVDLMLPEKVFKIPFFQNRMKRQLAPLSGLFDFFEEQINERLQEIKEGKRELKDEPEDFVDAFMAEIHKADNEQPNSFK